MSSNATMPPFNLNAPGTVKVNVFCHLLTGSGEASAAGGEEEVVVGPQREVHRRCEVQHHLPTRLRPTRLEEAEVALGDVVSVPGHRDHVEHHPAGAGGAEQGLDPNASEGDRP